MGEDARTSGYEFEHGYHQKSALALLGFTDSRLERLCAGSLHPDAEQLLSRSLHIHSDRLRTQSMFAADLSPTLGRIAFGADGRDRLAGVLIAGGVSVAPDQSDHLSSGAVWAVPAEHVTPRIFVGNVHLY